MKSGFLLLLFLLPAYIFSQNWNIDSVMNSLDEALLGRSVYEKAKLQKINEERIKYLQTPGSEYELKFRQAEVLYEEYKSYKFDSAFNYVLILNKLAYQLNDPGRISTARLKMGFILLSSGLFKEAIDTMLSVNPATLSKGMQVEYFSTLGRMYHDLADYNASPYYTKIYNRKGNDFLEKAIELIDAGSVQYQMLRGAEQLKSDQFESARRTFHRIYDNSTLTDHQRAIAGSTLGYIYTRLNKKEPAIYLLAAAAIYDIRSSTRETVALRNLANLLYEEGQIERAHEFVKIAMADAEFYNARHRKKEVGNVLPIIEGQQLLRIEKQKQQLILSLIFISVLGAVAIVLLISSTLQFFKLKKVKELLQKSYDNLTEANKKLHEANRIKEKYIGYYFNINANHLERIDKIQKTIHRKMTLKQYEGVLEYIDKDINMKKEVDELNANFDRIVLSLFPNFIQEFNKLFNPEDQIVLKEGQLLNNELRIFALIRMGISDNEKIAKILNYSVNTIYTYKTKIKNRSIVSNNEFEDHLMSIDT